MSGRVRSRTPTGRGREGSPRRILVDFGMHPPCAPSLAAVIFRQRGLRSEYDLAWILSDRPHHAVNVFQCASPFDGERFIFAQARVGETTEAYRDVLDPRIDVVCKLLDRKRRLADAV